MALLSQACVEADTFQKSGFASGFGKMQRHRAGKRELF